MQIPNRIKILSFFIVLGVSINICMANTLRIGDQKQQLKTLLTESGVLEGVPYPVEFFEFPAAAPLGEALNAGAVDIGAVGDAPFVFAAGAGRGLKAVAATETRGAYTVAIMVTKDSPINTVTDLKGKTIATTRGSIGHYLVLLALRDAGLQVSDVNLIFLLPSDARASFSAKRIDAWSTWGIYTTIAVTSEEARIIAKRDDYDSSIGFLVATPTAISQKAEQIRDLISRVDRAYHWANENVETYARIQSNLSGLPYQVHLELEANTTKRMVDIDDEVIAAIQTVADIYFEEKLLRRKTDVSGSFAWGFRGKKE